MSRVPVACSTAGCLGFATDGGRCPTHRVLRPSREERGLDARWLRLRDKARNRHVRTYGLICPGWGVPPHTVGRVQDLSGDHRVPRSEGGVARSADDIDILCVSCNSRRGATGSRNLGRGTPPHNPLRPSDAPITGTR